MRVLLAITDLDARSLWAEVLAAAGHAAVPIAPDVTWVQARHLHADLALVELAGDGTTGLELCRCLHDAVEWQPSILALAQPDQGEAMIAALAAGADDVLVGQPDRRSAASHLAAMERRGHAVGAGRPAADDLAAGYPPAARALHPAHATTRSGPPTVLLIDDEANMRLPLRLSLEHGGYRVFEARSGKEGLELIGRRSDEISLVLVDHWMPRMSGADMIRELRRRPSRRQLPIILMSGLSLADTGVCFPAPEAFLRKPFSLADLLRTVRQLIGPGKRATA